LLPLLVLRTTDALHVPCRTVRGKMTHTIPEFNIDLKSRLFLLAGPCVIESRDHVLFMAEALKKITSEFDISFVFKASFDKANRTSINSFRGPGMVEGLKLLAEVRKTVGVPIVTDVHLPDQAAPIAEVADILQIPAFLCRQTDVIIAAAKTGKIVNVKKGQFLAPWEMKNVVVKAHEAGNNNVLLTERGASFGYNNLVVDFRSIPIMKEFGCPVILDVTHSLQLPGARETNPADSRSIFPISRVPELLREWMACSWKFTTILPKRCRMVRML
jgi:2-dehydro-3-deoxyphosphooctonate aldolase (KDO 8-P synthase)